MPPKIIRTSVASTTLPWLISAGVSLAAIIAWGNSFSWAWHTLTAYTFFPVLGLLGFSLMWAQYVSGFMYKLTRWDGAALKPYFRYTGYAVLLAIVLHPGILIYQLFHDGLGLPPGSYERYLGPHMAWLALLGTVCLLIFLAFELRRWLSRKPWWKYVAGAGDAAMLGIFYHALRLGHQIHSGWFRWVWWAYGVTLVIILADKYSGPLMRQGYTYVKNSVTRSGTNRLSAP